MKYFQRSKGVHQNTFSLPCLAPEVSPKVVPLPGLLYDIKLPKSEGMVIAQDLKALSVGRFEKDLKGIELSDDYSRERLNAMTEAAAECLRFDKEMNLRNGAQIYVCLVPSVSADSNRACVAILEGFYIESALIRLTFRCILRATVQQPEINLKNSIWISKVGIVNETEYIKDLKVKDREKVAAVIHEDFLKLSEALEDFQARFVSAMRAKSEKDSRLMLLSPLATSLFLQLNRGSFNKAWSLLLSLEEELSKEDSSATTIQGLFRLMDMAMSVLPNTYRQRVQFLSLDDLLLRLSEFSNVTKRLRAMLQQLYQSISFIRSQFSDFEAVDRIKFATLQLSALRELVGPAHNNGRRLKSGPASSNSFGKSSVEGSENGQHDDEKEDEFAGIESFLKGIKEGEVHPDGLKSLHRDLRRLKRLAPQSSEFQLLKGYLDTIIDIPFGTNDTNKLTISLVECRKKLDSDHYGLQEVKKRLMEYLAVLKLNSRHEGKGAQSKPPILLLVGPPGVGKTSIAKSVAEVLNRKFHRISLGGIHSEAEIRGHRRTYVGSMCGLIVNALRKSGSMNPLILLDEIDKVLSVHVGGGSSGASLNGDPSAALLEVLDPEQNATFVDHYVGFPVDLSNVLFFCTANDLSRISAPLLNRVEVIEIPGYTPEEKINIGAKFLLPKQARLNGLDGSNIKVTLEQDAWDTLVMNYTREPGVRGLERRLASVIRGIVVEHVEKSLEGQHKVVSPKDLMKYLGFPLHPVRKELTDTVKFSEKCGVVNGLAYGSDGMGSVLVFEMVKTGHLQSGKNGPYIQATGNLGKVLKESIEIAATAIKSLNERKIILETNKSFFTELLTSEWHLHAPMGATSKDGPSAGAAIALALLSIAFQKPVPPNLCLTGEITLRGKILPIGGVKEKLLGARLFGMQQVLIPLSNRQDVIEAVMPSEEYTTCFESIERPELSRILQKWQLQVNYIDDIYDLILLTWPMDFQLNDTHLSSAFPTDTARASL